MDMEADIIDGDNLARRSADPASFARRETLAKIFDFTGIKDKNDFIFLAGVGVLILLTTATIVSTFTVRYLLHFAQRLGANFAATLFTHYMSKSWLFHASGNSSKLMNNLTIECNRVTVGIIYPIIKYLLYFEFVVQKMYGHNMESNLYIKRKKVKRLSFDIVKKVKSNKKNSLRGIVLENRVETEDYLDSVRTALKSGL